MPHQHADLLKGQDLAQPAAEAVAKAGEVGPAAKTALLAGGDRDAAIGAATAAAEVLTIRRLLDELADPLIEAQEAAKDA